MVFHSFFFHLIMPVATRFTFLIFLQLRYYMFQLVSVSVSVHFLFLTIQICSSVLIIIEGSLNFRFFFVFTFFETRLKIKLNNLKLLMQYLLCLSGCFFVYVLSLFTRLISIHVSSLFTLIRFVIPMSVPMFF